MDHTPSSEQNQIVQKIMVNWSGTEILAKPLLPLFPRTSDVSIGVKGTTAVAPKFSDTLTLFQPGVVDSAHHQCSRT